MRNNFINNVINTGVLTGTELVLNRVFKPNFTSDAFTLSEEALSDGNVNVAQSLYGMPVWDTIEFRYDSQALKIILPICITEVTHQRNIVVTPVQGLDGTIKEYISDGDKLIKIRATIVGDGIDYYPAEDIYAMEQILSIKDAIQVYSTILNTYFNVNNVVITEAVFSQPEVGMRNVQKVEITCISDYPENYTIIMGA